MFHVHYICAVSYHKTCVNIIFDELKKLSRISGFDSQQDRSFIFITSALIPTHSPVQQVAGPLFPWVKQMKHSAGQTEMRLDLLSCSCATL
jgi:hypothetical protein